MFISKKIRKFLIKLGKNFNTDEYIITAGVADLFNFNRLSINTDLYVGDIDINISDMNVLKKIEDVFNVKLELLQEFNEKPITFSNGFFGQSPVKQYFSHLTPLDIYYLENKNRFKSIETGIVDFYGIKLRYSYPSNTYLQSVNALNYNYEMDRKNMILKYLKKITIYNSLGYKI